MLKRNITYENFDGETVTEVFYFNISKAELLQLEAEYPEGVEKAFTRIANSGDNNLLFNTFKDFILRSYGQRSEDGKVFKKTPEIREAFEHSAAYDALLWEIATNEQAMTLFLNGIMPKNMKPMDQDKPVGPPPSRKAVGPPMPPTAR